MCYSPVCHSVEIQIQYCASTPSSMGHFVRLACLRHAASVHPEPGSNSQNKKNNFKNLNFLATNKLTFCSVFKDHLCAPLFEGALVI